MHRDFVYLGENAGRHWFHDKYFAGGSNSRYWTFQAALNLVNQKHQNPMIIETGCQRQKDDLGAGMSTSIFAEYIYRYGGSLIVCDNNRHHLDVAQECVEEWFTTNMTFIRQDSVKFLQHWQGGCDLLYLDSYDYPIVEIVRTLDSDWDKGLAKAKKLANENKLHELYGEVTIPCQEHCLNEFMAIEDILSPDTVLLIDDNDLPGGGKPGMLKPYLVDKGWSCLFDFQQTLWIKEL